MSTKFTDEELVLIAIIQNIPAPITPEKVLNKAKNLAETHELIYQGPSPDFTDEDLFGSSWNQLITKEYVRHVDSVDNRPRFESNIDIRAIDEICDKFIEKQSFYSILRD